MKSLLSFFASKENLEPNLEESLFFALMSSIPGQSWYALQDQEGKEDEESFVAGIQLPTGAVVYRFSRAFLKFAEKTGAQRLPKNRSEESSFGANAAKVLLKFATR